MWTDLLAVTFATISIKHVCRGVQVVHFKVTISIAFRMTNVNGSVYTIENEYGTRRVLEKYLSVWETPDANNERQNTPVGRQSVTETNQVPCEDGQTRKFSNITNEPSCVS